MTLDEALRECERLKAENEFLGRAYAGHAKQAATMAEMIRTQRAALEVFADEANWEVHWQSTTWEGKPYDKPWTIARKALSP